MTLASPSDFAAAHHAAYQAVGRVLGRVTGSRAIEAVQDGFVVAVEVEGYDEPFEVAAGYEKRRGWVAELRDGAGRVWAVGAGARLPEAVASMGRAGNPQITVKGKRVLADGQPLREAQDLVSEDNLTISQLPAVLFGQGAHILWFVQKPKDAKSVYEAPPVFLPAPMTQGIIPTFWKQKSAKKLVGAVQFRVTDSKIIVMYMAVQPKYRRNKANAVMIDEIVKTFPGRTLQFHDLTRDGRAFMSFYGGQEWKAKNPPTAHHWSSTGPASRKIYARGTIPRTTKTSPHLKKLYRALLKHYTARVALTKKGRTWDEVAAILKIRPKGRPSVALWGKALAERIFYAKIRGLAFSKDMIGKLPRAER